MNENIIKVQPKLVLIRFYMDFIIRHISAILIHIKSDAQNNTITFITINSATGVGRTKQRNITISNNVKFDMVELDSDGVSSDIMAKIFTNGYHEFTEYIPQRTESKGTVSVELDPVIHPAAENIPIKQKPARSALKQSRPITIIPVARVVPSSQDPQAMFADLAARASSAMQVAKNPTLYMDESFVSNESFDPDVQQVEVDEG